MKKESTSKIQEQWQSYGPHRPTVRQFIELLYALPAHMEVQAIAIRGQGGGVWIEARHDDGDYVYQFEEEDGRFVPHLVAPRS